ncbi:hypothetical protein OHA18_40185 [Kribbella sp. NBC_00709]|uniref:hypothetical protein n=1 Tax=Kribbella sp. NBC_00709 TaxID=2975972 RepID=UPI002E2AA858|nr:hypothetical protein [Kribbella sp. NBC_00709]
MCCEAVQSEAHPSTYSRPEVDRRGSSSGSGGRCAVPDAVQVARDGDDPGRALVRSEPDHSERRSVARYVEVDYETGASGREAVDPDPEPVGHPERARAALVGAGAQPDAIRDRGPDDSSTVDSGQAEPEHDPADLVTDEAGKPTTVKPATLKPDTDESTTGKPATGDADDADESYDAEPDTLRNPCHASNTESVRTDRDGGVTDRVSRFGGRL